MTKLNYIHCTLLFKTRSNTLHLKYVYIQIGWNNKVQEQNEIISYPSTPAIQKLIQSI